MHIPQSNEKYAQTQLDRVTEYSELEGPTRSLSPVLDQTQIVWMCFWGPLGASWIHIWYSGLFGLERRREKIPNTALKVTNEGREKQRRETFWAALASVCPFGESRGHGYMDSRYPWLTSGLCSWKINISEEDVLKEWVFWLSPLSYCITSLKQEGLQPEWSWLWLYVSVYLAPDRPRQMNGSEPCSIFTLQSWCGCTLGSGFGGWVCHGSLPLSVSLFWFYWAYVAVSTDIFQQGARCVRNTCVLCPWIERGRLWWNI